MNNDAGVVADGFTDETVESTNVSQQVNIDSGNEKKVLYLLCIGLTSLPNNDDDSGTSDGSAENKPLFCFDDEPWSLLPKTAIPRPQNRDYVAEIIRRATLYSIFPLPRPVNWSRTRRQMEWLESHPIKDKVDVDFLMAETLRLKQVLLRRAREQQVLLRRATEQQALTSDVAGGGSKEGGGSNWRGDVPYLVRMIMCFTQDHIKSAFLRRADAQSRTQIDARNSERRYVCCHCVVDSFISYLLTYACLLHRPLLYLNFSQICGMTGTLIP